MTVTPVLIQTLLFAGFSGLLLLSGFCVIALENPVKCALSLVVCFFSAAGLWLLLTAEFLALILILVYVGAVMTLFLFAVMTLQADNDLLKPPSLKYYLPSGLLLAVILTLLLGFALKHSPAFSPIFSKTISIASQLQPSVSNTVILGKILYTDYLLPFELTSVILLVAMIAAISLTMGVPILRNQQNIDQQIKVKKSERLKLIK